MDYIVQIKVKNGPMLRAMRSAGFNSARQLSLACGVTQSVIGSYLNLTRSPVYAGSKTGDKKGLWKEAIEKIAETLRTLPEELFPPQHIKTQLKQNTAEFETSLADIAQLVDQSRTPEDTLGAKQGQKLISDAIDTLTPREGEVIRRRYGLDKGHIEAQYEVGEALGISNARVHQIEQRALRKLRREARAKGLEDYVVSGTIEG